LKKRRNATLQNAKKGLGQGPRGRRGASSGTGSLQQIFRSQKGPARKGKALPPERRFCLGLFFLGRTAFYVTRGDDSKKRTTMSSSSRKKGGFSPAGGNELSPNLIPSETGDLDRSLRKELPSPRKKSRYIPPQKKGGVSLDETGPEKTKKPLLLLEKK